MPAPHASRMTPKRRFSLVKKNSKGEGLDDSSVISEITMSSRKSRLVSKPESPEEPHTFASEVDQRSDENPTEYEPQTSDIADDMSVDATSTVDVDSDVSN